MTLRPGQLAQVWIADVRLGTTELVFESDRHFEAPNWFGDELVLNADGALFRMPIGSAPERVEFGASIDINNDHVVSPDGAFIYVSGRDGHLYEVGWAGGSLRRVTSHGPGFKAYLHGISADGESLSFIGGSTETGSWRTNVHTIPVAGGAGSQLTADDHEDDGAEFGSDGRVYFNSTRGSVAAGHAQLFSMASDGSDIQQLTFDERVNWLHPSPSGEHLVYLSYPAGTLGHPADLPVQLRLLGESEPLVQLHGGQGTINVPSWSPDGDRFAYAAYPLA